MKKTIMVFSVLSCAAIAGAALPADAIFREAEDFKQIEKGWDVVPHGQHGYRGRPSGGKLVRGFQSAMGKLSDTFTVTKAGDYKINFRYLDLQNLGQTVVRNEIAFRVTVTQNDKTVAEKIFDDGESIRSTPDGKAKWGNGWGEFVWGTLDAKLEAGEFTITFSKVHRRDTTGLARNIDCVLITSDASYEPKVEDFEKKQEEQKL